MNTRPLTLLDARGQTIALAPGSDTVLRWPQESFEALMRQMRSMHPDMYVLHNQWHQAIPAGTSRKQSLRLFYEYNLRERFSPAECRRAAEEILARLGRPASWLNESWGAEEDAASYDWGFLLAFLLRPRAVLILGGEKIFPSEFTSFVARLRDDGVAIVWCEHA